MKWSGKVASGLDPATLYPAGQKNETIAMGFQCLSFQDGFAGSVPQVGEDPVHRRCLARGCEDRQRGFHMVPTSKKQLGQSSDFFEGYEY